MFCPHCGFPADEGDLFCCRCGKETPEGREQGQIAAKRKLRRPGDAKKVGGVCAGFAGYWNKDVTLIRLLWTGVSLVPPFVHGPLAYGVCWALIPRNEQEQQEQQESGPPLSGDGSTLPHSS